MREAEVLLVCWRADDPEAIVVPGSVVRTCRRCGREVWVAPTGVAMLETRAALVECVFCALRSMRAAKARGEPVTIESMTPEQRRELD